MPKINRIFRKRRKKKAASGKRQPISYNQSITIRMAKGQSNDVINEQMQIIKSITHSMISEGGIF